MTKMKTFKKQFSFVLCVILTFQNISGSVKVFAEAKNGGTNTITVKENKIKLELQDVELYVGETFDLDTPLKNVTDKDGKKLQAKDIKMYIIDGELYIYEGIVTKVLDTSKPGIHKVQVGCLDELGRWQLSEKKTITIKEDKTKVELKDVELYVGETFDPDTPLKNVTDKDGKKLQAKDIEEYYIDEVKTKVLDTSKPGIHKVRIIYLDGKGKWRYSETKTITVKEDKIKLELQDVELYVGETFDSDTPLKNVTDKDGKKLQAKDIKWYYIDEVLTKVLDTSKPGIHKVRIVYLDGKGKWRYSETKTITVKEDKTKVELQDVELYVGETFDSDTPLKNVTDKDGKKLQAKDIKWYYIDEVLTKVLDTSKPGIHKVRIVYIDGTGKFKYSETNTITVKEDKWVNVTIPTKMLFFSDMKSAKKDKVISKSYSITNNSDNTSLEVVMASFAVAKESEVIYLSAADAPPAISKNKLRLNLLVNGQTKVQGLTNETKPIHLMDLNVKKSAKLTFEGDYFNVNSEGSSKAKSRMVLKFNIK